MDVVWIVAGTALLLFTLADTFFTVLNYNERGLLVNRFVQIQWVVIRFFTRKVKRHRNLVLRQVTGIVLGSIIMIWVIGIVLGFALIYYGAIGLGAVTAANSVVPDFWGALYLSIGQFATVGVDHISPAVMWTRILSVVETLVSVLLLSMVITFLVNIYNSIQALRTLCASFPSVANTVTSPLDSLAPFFQTHDTVSLELHLIAARTNLNGYFDSLAQDHPAYYFQSGKDRFAMPFAVFMVAGTLGGLLGGLPHGHPARLLPGLVRLQESFANCRDQMYQRFSWPSPENPAPLSQNKFIADFDNPSDPWVARFRVLVHSMSKMTGVEVPSADAKELYDRYVQWLEFTTIADGFVAVASRDLDFQPAYVHGQYSLGTQLQDYGWQLAKASAT